MVHQNTCWILSFLLGGVILSCSSQPENSYPNRLQPVYDLPHYERDTLNFYQVDLDVEIEESIDSILTKCGPPLPHLSWILVFQPESKGELNYSLSVTPTSNVFIDLDTENLTYKSATVSGVQVLIIDYGNFTEVNLNKPLVPVWNRKLHSGYSHVSFSSWFFEKKEEQVVLESTWGVH